MLLRNEVTHASDLELLAAVIGNRRTAEKLFKEAGGSLFNLMHTLPQEQGDLFCAQGSSAYATPLMKLQAARELAARAIIENLSRGDALSSPQAVRDFLKHRLAGIPHEVFVAILLDAQNRVLSVENLFRGTLTQTSVFPREIVKLSLRLNAAAIIFAHNHPSGIAEPSRADEALTQTLKHTLALVDVKVLDHFIVGGTACMSFAERGLI